jgi:hypothetical protein
MDIAKSYSGLCAAVLNASTPGVARREEREESGPLFGRWMPVRG